jgi:hypothetical protein
MTRGYGPTLAAVTEMLMQATAERDAALRTIAELRQLIAALTAAIGPP